MLTGYPPGRFRTPLSNASKGRILFRAACRLSVIYSTFQHFCLGLSGGGMSGMWQVTSCNCNSFIFICWEHFSRIFHSLGPVDTRECFELGPAESTPREICIIIPHSPRIPPPAVGHKYLLA